MSNSFEKVGFVGFGPMGQLMASRMFEGAEIEFVDPGMQGAPDGFEATQQDNPFNFAYGDVDAAVLTVPARAMRDAAYEIVRVPQTSVHWPKDIRDDFNAPLVVEPCSVKMFPQAVIETIDPHYPELLHCHPLFGPQSAADSVEGKTLVVTKKVGEKADRLLDCWDKLGLDIIEMSAEDHDRMMVKIHIIPFALGRIANKLGLHELAGSRFEATYFKAAVALAELDKKQSEELFRTIMEFNPFAWEATQIIQEQAAEICKMAASGKDRLAELDLLLNN